MVEKKISEYMRLKDNHPTMVKLQKLYDLAEELKIQISFSQSLSVVNDRDLPEDHPMFRLEDLDSGEAVEEWPPTFEYKIIYQNPAYITEETRLRKEREATAVAENKKKAEAQVARRKAEEEERKQETERKERAELARLKRKYEEDT